MNGLRSAAILFSLASLHFAGCCCVPNSTSMSPLGGCGTGCCDDGAPRHPGLFDCACGGSGCGSCGGHVLAKIGAHKSCQGACGEVYYDEWINEPPVADNCGFSCGGCGACGQCRPLLKKLRMLWGTPYHACCPSPFECGGSCGCDSCGHAGHIDAGYHASTTSSGCNCGSSHGEVLHSSPSGLQPVPAPNYMPQSTAPEAPYEEVTPTPVPDPAADPDVTSSSALRLNPARQKGGVRYASAQRRR